MPGRINGIQTAYNGILFRSRVEARWAAVFDNLGWSWEYEPIDLQWYIPDFLVSVGISKILFEIKHTVSDEEITQYQDKIANSGWTGEAVILRSYIDDKSSQPVLGWFGERDCGQLIWGEARAFCCLSCGHISILAGDGSWHCRTCGFGDGNSHIGTVGNAISDAWAYACNRVQWRAG